LKSRAESVFNKRKAKPMQWELSTWSKHVRRSSIENNRTKSNKAALPTGTSRYNKPRKTGTFKRKRKPSDHRRRSWQPPRQHRMAVVALPALPNNSSSASSDNELPESPTRRSIRSAAIRAAAKVAAAVDDNSSSDSSSSKWESSTPEQPELFESPRQSTLRSAARVAAKKAARKAEEDKKNETEDEECGRNVLDDMIYKLGTRKEVEKDIRDHRRNRQGLEPSDDDQKCPT
jgi:hypothetical protein